VRADVKISEHAEVHTFLLSLRPFVLRHLTPGGRRKHVCASNCQHECRAIWQRRQREYEAAHR
jgi:hypothetical protein